MTNENKTTEELLEAAGYVDDGAGNVGRPGRPQADIYRKVRGGYEVYSMAGSSVVIGAGAWGRPAPEYPGRVQVPYRQAEKFAMVSGIHPGETEHADMFEWVWPEERIREIFTYANPHDRDGNVVDNPWVKVDNGEGQVEYKRARN